MNTKSVNNDTKGFAGVLVILAVLVILGVGLFYVVNSGMLVKLNPNNTAVINTVPKVEQPALVKVDFTYKVKSITPTEIVLTGQKGDLTLPNDPAAVTAYKGATNTSPKMELSRLKVGDSLNLEFIPGKSATLFVLL